MHKDHVPKCISRPQALSYTPKKLHQEAEISFLPIKHTQIYSFQTLLLLTRGKMANKTSAK
jgi:hypothetical protein